MTSQDSWESDKICRSSDFKKSLTTSRQTANHLYCMLNGLQAAAELKNNIHREAAFRSLSDYET